IAGARHALMDDRLQPGSGHGRHRSRASRAALVAAAADAARAVAAFRAAAPGRRLPARTVVGAAGRPAGAGGLAAGRAGAGRHLGGGQGEWTAPAHRARAALRLRRGALVPARRSPRLRLHTAALPEEPDTPEQLRRGGAGARAALAP